MTTSICPGCGRKTAVREPVAVYHYRECGLDSVWLSHGVSRTQCTACSEVFVRVEREPQLLQVIALDLLLNRVDWTGAELKYLRNACELSQAGLAELLGTRRATVAEREAKPDPRLGVVERIGIRVVLLKAFRDHLGRPGCDHLTARHRRELATFMTRYCDEALGLMSPSARRAARRQFTSLPSGRSWELPAAA